MVRYTAAFFILVLYSQSLQAQAQPGADPRIATALAVQTAMTRAREHLQANRPDEAVAVLEAEILHVNGSTAFLTLMKQAYIAQLKEVKQKGDADRIDHIRQQLRTLDPKLNLDELLAGAATTPAAVPEKPASITAPAPAPAAAQSKLEIEDPFQQTPLDRAGAPVDFRKQARMRFEQKQYAEAADLFAKAIQAGVALSAEEKHAWGYCRLSVAVKRLGDVNAPKNSLAALEKETQEAMKLGGSTLEGFGQQVLAEIRKRMGTTSASVIPKGWQAHETGSFRIFYQQSRQQAEQVGKAAEQFRAATYGTWVGPANADWSPRCDLWLHANGADYAKVTDKPAALPGHSSVGIKDGKVMVRRIDLRLDDAGLTEITMPREVAYVVLADLFPEQPLPRWADVGMSILAEPQGEVSRYRRAVAKLMNEKKLFSLRDFLKMAEFPEAEKITPFYVESVSLVDFLVKLKGPKAFALYLREAPRRGYEEALQRHYGFKDANELQENWLKFAMKGD